MPPPRPAARPATLVEARPFISRTNSDQGIGGFWKAMAAMIEHLFVSGKETFISIPRRTRNRRGNSWSETISARPQDATHSYGQNKGISLAGRFAV
jgi:hypothetical protein